MQKITLSPGVWTQVDAARFIQSKSNQSGLRIHYNYGPPAPPEPDTDLFFTTAEFDLKPVSVPTDIVGLNTYLMPDENMPIDVVVF